MTTWTLYPPGNADGVDITALVLNWKVQWGCTLDRAEATPRIFTANGQIRLDNTGDHFTPGNANAILDALNAWTRIEAKYGEQLIWTGLAAATGAPILTPADELVWNLRGSHAINLRNKVLWRTVNADGSHRTVNAFEALTALMAAGGLRAGDIDRPATAIDPLLLESPRSDRTLAQAVNQLAVASSRLPTENERGQIGLLDRTRYLNYADGIQPPIDQVAERNATEVYEVPPSAPWAMDVRSIVTIDTNEGEVLRTFTIDSLERQSTYDLEVALPADALGVKWDLTPTQDDSNVLVALTVNRAAAHRDTLGLVVALSDGAYPAANVVVKLKADVDRPAIAQRPVIPAEARDDPTNFQHLPIADAMPLFVNDSAQQLAPAAWYRGFLTRTTYDAKLTYSMLPGIVPTERQMRIGQVHHWRINRRQTIQMTLMNALFEGQRGQVPRLTVYGIDMAGHGIQGSVVAGNPIGSPDERSNAVRPDIPDPTPTPPLTNPNDVGDDVIPVGGNYEWGNYEFTVPPGNWQQWGPFPNPNADPETNGSGVNPSAALLRATLVDGAGQAIGTLMVTVRPRDDSNPAQLRGWLWFNSPPSDLVASSNANVQSQLDGPMDVIISQLGERKLRTLSGHSPTRAGFVWGQAVAPSDSIPAERFVSLTSHLLWSGSPGIQNSFEMEDDLATGRAGQFVDPRRRLDSDQPITISLRFPTTSVTALARPAAPKLFLPPAADVAMDIPTYVPPRIAASGDPRFPYTSNPLNGRAESDRDNDFVVVHTGEGGLTGASGDRLKLAEYLIGLTWPEDDENPPYAGYHYIVDEGGWTKYLDPRTHRAYHARHGGNDGIGLAFACSASDWATMPAQRWQAMMGQAAAALVNDAGWRGPNTRITSWNRANPEAGLYGHATIQPEDRTDPGARFLWAALVFILNQAVGG